jgi:hypothetical protein
LHVVEASRIAGFGSVTAMPDLLAHPPASATFADLHNPFTAALRRGGISTRALAPHFAHLFSVDGSSAAVAHARREISSFSHVTVVQAALPARIRTGLFDAIIASDVLYYLPQSILIRTLTLAHAGLKIGGRVISTNHLKRFEDAERGLDRLTALTRLIFGRECRSLVGSEWRCDIFVRRKKDVSHTGLERALLSDPRPQTVAEARQLGTAAIQRFFSSLKSERTRSHRCSVNAHPKTDTPALSSLPVSLFLGEGTRIVSDRFPLQARSPGSDSMSHNELIGEMRAAATSLVAAAVATENGDLAAAENSVEDALFRVQSLLARLKQSRNGEVTPHQHR